ncbi:hypothetical protein SAMN05421852_10310 [Thermoflavimicrobium dichotomicum]|uniref:Uncharacterized protein n=1 Tax=Thermoflavimicrobium dichotomicum TaxID=46223 RepID=A0A1I3MDA8_9BACL|nr:hypothetical protein SAMN05421852_10310 [Thermoflavimicrobium dichotomicum]
MNRTFNIILRTTFLVNTKLNKIIF